jgi:hypothetical protein
MTTAKWICNVRGCPWCRSKRIKSKAAFVRLVHQYDGAVKIIDVNTGRVLKGRGTNGCNYWIHSSWMHIQPDGTLYGEIECPMFTGILHYRLEPVESHQTAGLGK